MYIYILLVILFVNKGYGLVSARRQPYHTRLEATHFLSASPPPLPDILVLLAMGKVHNGA